MDLYPTSKAKETGAEAAALKVLRDLLRDFQKALKVLLLDFQKIPRRRDRFPCLQVRLRFERRLSKGR